MKTQATTRQGAPAPLREYRPLPLAENGSARKKPSGFDSAFYIRLNARNDQHGIRELSSPLSDY